MGNENVNVIIVAMPIDPRLMGVGKALEVTYGVDADDVFAELLALLDALDDEPTRH